MARSRSGPSRKGRRDAGGGDLKVGLLAAVEDREEPCMEDGCTSTWTYTGRMQLENLGRNPPPGRCAEHRGAELGIATREERCKVDGCTRTWTWSAERQMELMFPEGYTPGARPKKVRTPSRMCELCFQKSKRLEPRSAACKVHGCSREAVADRDSLLRAWVALGTKDLSAEPPTPRRMCEVCRDYCRTHKDREVVCVRSGCDRTWTYKTGAQLQAFLAGRVEDPQRPCATCQSEEDASGSIEHAGAGRETLPCVVPGCSGTWLFGPGVKVAPASEGALPIDRMCAEHRAERGS